MVDLNHMYKEIKTLNSNILVNEDSTLKQSIKKMNKNGMQILFVLKKNKFLGTLSSGDIRRGLLKNINLKSKIKSIYNNKPSYIKIIGKKKILIKNNKINPGAVYPLIDNKKKILGYSFKNIKNIINNSFIIFAGGYGSRLYPLTKNLPKPMLRVNKKPIISHIIDNAIKIGFSNFIIITHYLSFKIKKYLKKKYPNTNLKFVNEHRPLGTAGALYFLKKKTSKDFMVVNGDIISSINFFDILNTHIKDKNIVTIGAILVEKSKRYGIILNIGDKVKKIIEKPIENNLINAGVYVFNKKILKFLNKPKNLSMVDFLNTLLKKKIKIKIYPIHENWNDLGTMKDYIKFSNS